MFATQIFKVIGHFKLRNFWQLLQKLVEKAVEFNSSQLIFRQEFLKYVLEILLLKTSFFDKNFRSEFRIDHSLKNTNQLIFPFPECSGYPVPLTWGRLEFDPGRKQIILFFFFWMSDNLYEDIDCGTDAHPLFVTDYVCQGKLGFKETIVSTYYFLSICFLVYYCERYFKKH